MTGGQTPLAAPSAAGEFLIAAGLAAADDAAVWTPVTGGVSSELWRVDLPTGTICVKGALDKLRVDADWHAPRSRNAVEWEWLSFAHRTFPGCVPVPLAHAPDLGLFAMSYLPPESAPVWKQQLVAGHIDVAFAAQVGDLLGQLHRASAQDPAIRDRFATDGNFDQLRLTPYLVSTAKRHPDRAEVIAAITGNVASTHRVLVHGDVSPKNILCGPDGPVFLDAECAWFGDPAFDLAFVVNHLLLKTVIVPASADRLAGAAAALVTAYVGHVDWEPDADVSARTARLLPALLLARVDGDSPVEYLDRVQQEHVRRIARAALESPDGELSAKIATLAQDLSSPARV
ncbi:aminoglycoside phosphotransferase family protein [Gordonia sp. CPCC 205515]|uniref:phosphotransferase family protein n=1 Tax=Gordonia sp. CPCC 205515 TaxID=3140791 RepID=UPI003AF39EFE